MKPTYIFALLISISNFSYAQETTVANPTPTPSPSPTPPEGFPAGQGVDIGATASADGENVDLDSDKTIETVTVTGRRIQSPMLFALVKRDRMTLMLGTLRFGVQLADFPEFIETKIKEAEYVAVENSRADLEQMLVETDDLDKISRPYMVRSVADKSVYDSLSSDIRNDLREKYGDDFVASLSAVRSPILACMMLEREKIKQGQLYSVDYEIEGLARENQAIVVSAAELTPRTAKVMVQQQCELNSAVFASAREDLLLSFFSGDLARLKIESDVVRTQNPTAWDTLYTQENSRWVRKIDYIHQYSGLKNENMVVVGAFRLVGDQNLLTQLGEDGYRIFKIKNEIQLSQLKDRIRNQML